MSATFELRYVTACAVCDEDIFPGTTVRYGAFDEIIHDRCPAAPGKRPICPTCHLELPLSGVCGDCS